MPKGLTTAEAERRRRESGENQLCEEKRTHPVCLFAGQFKDFMVLVLLVGAGISVLLGEITDAVTIAIIVLLNAILGFVQEYRTERTLEALRSMTAPTARVLRDGKRALIPAAELVPGDYVLLEAGDRVPADCALQSVRSLFAEESMLTGESTVVQKSADAPNDRDNAVGKAHLVYAGTNITGGNGEGVVIATGKQTQMGQISEMLSEIDAGQTPLQKRLGELGRILALMCLAVCFVVFLAGVLRGEPVFDMLLTGITIAIAAIPEGLPATVTIALALAVSRMLKQHALVNRLHSVETLGCASVICSDKTGTITENKMTVTALSCAGEEYEVLGSGYRIRGELRLSGAVFNPAAKPALLELLQCAVLCSNAEIHTDTDPGTRSRGSLTAKGEWQVSGDPTELALLVAAAKADVTARSLRHLRRLAEEPFDSSTKCMAVLVQSDAGKIAYVKGALERLLPRCGFYRAATGVLPLTPAVRREILERAQGMSSAALRVLAMAQKDCEHLQEASSGLVFLGLAGMQDPIRPEAKEAIRLCARAHIRTVMITGDHPATAEAIAKQAGLLRGKKVITGAELDRMSDEALRLSLNDYSVFARVNPSHKLRLVRAYRSRGEIVTMTGDGVNDAPAIKEADVGVSMGITGTDVTKQAADVILLDDNFATLVRAVEQGRAIYANIRKFVRYLLSCNIGEVITMLLGILMGMPMVLLPVQLLLVNLVTDGLPAIALGMEPPERGVMQRPPRCPQESFFSGGLMRRIVFRGCFIGLCTLGCFTSILRTGDGVEAARTGALLTLVLSQLIHVFECKTEEGSIFNVPYFNNAKLLLAVVVSMALIFGAVYVPWMQMVFSTVALGRASLLIAVAFSLAVPLIAGLFRFGENAAQR